MEFPLFCCKKDRIDEMRSRVRFIERYKFDVKKKSEYFTKYQLIEDELKNYTNAFQGKVVYLNCDEVQYSQYWRYFYDNFKALGLKKLVATHYNPDVPKGIDRFIVDGEYVHKYEYDGTRFSKKPLQGDGDYRSEECMDILHSADMVVTTPPTRHFCNMVRLFERLGKEYILCR